MFQRVKRSERPWVGENRREREERTPGGSFDLHHSGGVGSETLALIVARASAVLLLREPEAHYQRAPLVPLGFLNGKSSFLGSEGVEVQELRCGL